MTHNTVLIESSELFANMVDDNYFIPVKFTNSESVFILRFNDELGLIQTQADADKFYKAFHFAFMVALRGGFQTMEEHIQRNFGTVKFVGLLTAEEAKEALGKEIIAELAYQF